MKFIILEPGFLKSIFSSTSEIPQSICLIESVLKGPRLNQCLQKIKAGTWTSSQFKITNGTKNDWPQDAELTNDQNLPSYKLHLKSKRVAFLSIDIFVPNSYDQCNLTI